MAVSNIYPNNSYTRLVKKVTGKQLHKDDTVKRETPKDINAPITLTIESEDKKSTSVHKISDHNHIRDLIKYSNTLGVQSYGIIALCTTILSAGATPFLIKLVKQDSLVGKMLAGMFDATAFSPGAQSIYNQEDSIWQKFLKFCPPAIASVVGMSVLKNKLYSEISTNVFMKNLKTAQKENWSYDKFQNHGLKLGRAVSFGIMIGGLILTRLLQVGTGELWSRLFPKPSPPANPPTPELNTSPAQDSNTIQEDGLGVQTFAMPLSPNIPPKHP